MRAPKKKPPSTYRRRLKRRGLVRLEVRVHKDDVALVRSVVEALADPKRGDEARALLRDRFGAAFDVHVSRNVRAIHRARSASTGRSVLLSSGAQSPTGMNEAQ